MDDSKVTEGFARVSVNLLKYIVAILILVLLGTAAFRFGTEIYTDKGVEDDPGTDMTFTVEEGTSIEEFGSMLEEYNVIRSYYAYRIQALIQGIDSIEPGTYTFNNSDSCEEILQVIEDGPEENETEAES